MDLCTSVARLTNLQLFVVHSLAFNNKRFKYSKNKLNINSELSSTTFISYILTNCQFNLLGSKKTRSLHSSSEHEQMKNFEPMPLSSFISHSLLLQSFKTKPYSFSAGLWHTVSKVTLPSFFLLRKRRRINTFYQSSLSSGIHYLLFKDL